MDRATFERQRAAIFSDLFNCVWENKKIWELIKNEKMAATPAFEGKLYRKANIKVMFVGRALNGWDKPLENCSTLENTVNSVLRQEGAFETFVDPNGFGNGPRKYYHKNTKFFRFIKQVLELVGESDPDVDNTWYDDEKQWNQRFIWANLYSIAPRNPKPGTNANPHNAMIKPCVDKYVELMKLYIDYYNPDAVVFITDVNGWFIKWKREKSFKDITNNYQEVSNNDTIVATGNIGRSKIVVCRRPDRRGYSYERVSEMAKVVSNWILENK